METEATYMAQDADLQKYIRSLKKLKPCTPAEEASLAASIKAGGEDSVEAAKRLVDSHQPLAFSMASRYRGRGIATMDLIQEAILGLYDAVPNFDPSKARFGTYARWWALLQKSPKFLDYEWPFGNHLRWKQATDAGKAPDSICFHVQI